MLYMAQGDRLISHIYRALREDLKAPTLPVQARWEEAKGEPLSEREWIKVHEGVKEVNSNPRFKLVHYNFIHQTYLSPKTLGKIFPNRSNECPPCRTQEADFLHVVWHCPVINSYWIEILDKLEKATGWTASKEMRTVLLGLLPTPKNKKLTRKLVMLGLILAKRRIAISWRSPNPPCIKSWLSDWSEWATAEAICMKRVRHNEKVEDDLHAWTAMLTDIKDMQTAIATPTTNTP